jgi:hypothetical protein
MTTAAANFSLLGKRFQIAYRDSDGYPIGVQEDGTIVAADDAAIGETYNAVTVNGFVSFTAPVKEVEYATDQSDGTNKGKIPMGINDYGTGEIELSEEDELALNMIKNVSTDTTLNTSWRVTSGNDTSITMLRSPSPRQPGQDKQAARTRTIRPGAMTLRHQIALRLSAICSRIQRLMLRKTTTHTALCGVITRSASPRTSEMAQLARGKRSTSPFTTTSRVMCAIPSPKRALSTL